MKWHPLFPGSLKLLACFCNWPLYKEGSQALTWRAYVTRDHIISLKYRAWIGSAEWQKARSSEGNAFPTFITDGFCLQLCQGAFQSPPPSLYTENSKPTEFAIDASYILVKSLHQFYLLPKNPNAPEPCHSDCSGRSYA